MAPGGMIHRLRRAGLLALPVFLVTVLHSLPAVPAQEASGLISGPMPGVSAMRAVTLWLQGAGENRITLEYWPVGDPEMVLATEPHRLEREQQYATHIEITGLQPGTRYQYRVLIDGEPAAIPEPLMFRTQPLWQWRSDPPDFRMVAGSCAFINDPPYDRPGKPYGDRYDIFGRIAARTPDMMLWLGDNIYLREADLDSRWGMAERYRQVRALPELQSLLRATHHYALWDDHDYGPDNANRSFPLKDHSLTLFRRYWANLAYGLPELPGVFNRFSFHDVDFFLLDGRYYRNSEQAPDTPAKGMFGDAQLEWLKDALLQSRATFKIIASGTQLLNNRTGSEGWNYYPDEREGFLAWLEETGIPGVVFLSGDGHYSALFRLEREAHYTLYELSCSPLTAGPRRKDVSSGNTRLVPGTYTLERNFCEVDFTGAGDDRRMRISVIDADGRLRWNREISALELRD